MSESPSALPGAPTSRAALAETESIEIATTDGVGERLDKFLASRLESVSRGRIQRWIELGAVRCEERVLARDTRLTGGEKLTVIPQPLDAEKAFTAEAVGLDVLAHEADFYIIDKPAGLVVHPAPGNWHGTMLNGLLHLDASLKRLPRAGIVHRLDKNTSGVLVVARTEPTRLHLTERLAARQVSRTYLAVTHGRLSEPTVIAEPIGRDPRNRLRMAVVANGKEAVTMIRPIAHGRSDGGDFSVLRCDLMTGRTHQIRVHLAHNGFPIVADTLYGGKVSPGMDRQALHAFQLHFDRPDGTPAGPYVSRQGSDVMAWLERHQVNTQAVRAELAAPLVS